MGVCVVYINIEFELLAHVAASNEFDIQKTGDSERERELIRRKRYSVA